MRWRRRGTGEVETDGGADEAGGKEHMLALAVDVVEDSEGLGGEPERAAKNSATERGRGKGRQKYVRGRKHTEQARYLSSRTGEGRREAGPRGSDLRRA